MPRAGALTLMKESEPLKSPPARAYRYGETGKRGKPARFELAHPPDLRGAHTIK